MWHLLKKADAFFGLCYLIWITWKEQVKAYKTIHYIEQIFTNPIGTIHTLFNDVLNMPIQPIAAEGVRGYIELLPEYILGLKDFEGFSHLTLVYRFHKIVGYALEVIPFMDDTPRGIFATKAPKRPNAIGISTVMLISIFNKIQMYCSICILLNYS